MFVMEILAQSSPIIFWIVAKRPQCLFEKAVMEMNPEEICSLWGPQKLLKKSESNLN